MNQAILENELYNAMKERQYKHRMLDYVDKDFTDTVIYEIKAMDCKISALKRRLEGIESENKVDKQKTDNNFGWNGYILACVNQPIGTAVAGTSCRAYCRR